MNPGEGPASPNHTEAPRHYPAPLAALGITFAAAFVSAIAMSIFGSEPNYGTIGVGQVMGYGLVAILATQRVPQPHSIRLGLRGFERDFLPTLVLLVPLVFMLSEVDNIIRDLTPPLPPPDPDSEALALDLGESTLYGTIQRVIFIVGLSPVMEEWLFRGVIQQGLVGNFGRTLGVLLTSTLFALGHVGFGLAPGTLLSFFLSALAFGVVLGCVRIATGSLLAAMLLHAAFSAVAVAADLAKEDFPITGFTVPDTHSSFALLAPSAVAVGVAVVMLRRALREAPPEPPLDWVEPEPERLD